MPEGTIIKALSGYYYVSPDQGGEALQCRARGIFKKQQLSPKVGDRVSFDPTEQGEGWVTDIHDRFSELLRPPIANVDLALLVFSLTKPTLNLQLLDKMLVHVENAGVQAAIVLTKQDLLDFEEPDMQLAADEAFALYRQLGYPVYMTNLHSDEDIDKLQELLKGRITVFCGQSGVGKSSLLNRLLPNISLQTGGISTKLGRGRHTTRHVELHPSFGGGYAADTPGFSQLDFIGIDAETLSACFVEFTAYADGCKFRGCQHLHEPSCKVQDALQTGQIANVRYRHYVDFLTEIKEQKRRY